MDRSSLLWNRGFNQPAQTSPSGTWTTCTAVLSSGLHAGCTAQLQNLQLQRLLHCSCAPVQLCESVAHQEVGSGPCIFTEAALSYVLWSCLCLWLERSSLDPQSSVGNEALTDRCCCAAVIWGSEACQQHLNHRRWSSGC